MSFALELIATFEKQNDRHYMNVVMFHYQCGRARLFLTLSWIFLFIQFELG